jgi:hypothetical protein
MSKCEFIFARALSSCFFLLEGTCLTRYSSLSASLLVISELVPTNVTGLRDLVYLEPLPELCSASRFFRLLVIPQYKDLSEHRTRYTTHCRLVIFVYMKILPAWQRCQAHTFHIFCIHEKFGPNRHPA